MELKAYLSGMDAAAREEFASRCGTTRGHLQNVMYGKKCAAELATAIEVQSGGQVTRRELRTDWQRVWPELARLPVRRLKAA